MTQAIIYARFSPRRDAETSERNEAQFEICRKFADSRGWEIVETFEDRAMSGSEPDRPGLWDAIDALRPGYVLLVRRLDRLARDTYLAIMIERAVAKRKSRIVSAFGESSEDVTPEGKLIRSIMAAFADYQRKVMAIRTSHAMRIHQKNGRRMSSKLPYGFTNDPDDPARMIEHPAEMRAIERILELHASNLSLRRIAKTMDAEQWPRRSSKWHHTQVRTILKRHSVV